MPRTKKISVEEATGDVKSFFDAIQKKFSRVPNMFQQMALSPAVLKGYIGLEEVAKGTSLSPLLREQIALVVGQTNHCNYCIAAHTAGAKAQGLSEAAVEATKKGESTVTKEAAILKFAKNLVEKRAQLTKEDIENLKKAGVSEKEILETFLVVIVNIFTNYFNILADTEVDFPTTSKQPLQTAKR